MIGIWFKKKGIAAHCFVVEAIIMQAIPFIKLFEYSKNSKKTTTQIPFSHLSVVSLLFHYLK